MKYKVAAIQIEAGSYKEENVKRVSHQLDLTAQERVKFACLAEDLRYGVKFLRMEHACKN